MVQFVEKMPRRSKKFDKKKAKKMFRDLKKKDKSKPKFKWEVTCFGYNRKAHYKIECLDLQNKDEKSKKK